MVMSASEILEQIRRLPPEEQSEVAEQVWAEFGGMEDELTPEEAAELDRRAEAAPAHPERCRPLKEVIADLEKRSHVRQ